MAQNDIPLAGERSRLELASSTTSETESCLLWSDLCTLQDQVHACEREIREGEVRRLPGNVAFLGDGRVLCRQRSRGDSRYPYGSNGFNFWVNASGYMHANRGFVFPFSSSSPRWPRTADRVLHWVSP